MRHGSLVGRLIVVGGGVVVAGLVSLFCLNPIAGLVTTSLLTLGTVAIVRPLALACLLGFLTVAFPKAGFQINDFPFPVFLLGLLVAVLALRAHAWGGPTGPPRVVRSSFMGASSLFVVWILLRCAVYADDGLPTIVPFVAWTLVPLAIAGVCVTMPVSGAFGTALKSGFLVSVGYAVLQFVMGVESVAVAGLTYSYGDDLSLKNNFISSESVDFSKIPSTYHNGNIYGTVSIVFMVLAVRRLLAREATLLDWVVLAGSAFALTASGSRTAVVAGGVAGIILIFGRGAYSRKASLLALLLAGVAAVLAAQPALLQRYSLGDVLASGGAGRSEGWRNELDAMSALDLVIGRSVRIVPEGWLGMVADIGLVGVVLLVLAYARVLRNAPGFGPVVAGLATAAVLDSAFLLFPTWFIPAALLATPIVSARRADDGDSGVRSRWLSEVPDSAAPSHVTSGTTHR